MEFVRRINQDDFVIITNRLRTDLYLSFYRQTDPSVLESFAVHSQTGKVVVTLFKSGTLVVRGDSKTREFQKITETIIDVLEHGET